MFTKINSNTNSKRQRRVPVLESILFFVQYRVHTTCVLIIRTFHTEAYFDQKGILIQYDILGLNPTYLYSTAFTLSTFDAEVCSVGIIVLKKIN